jgi:ferrous iron transport protein B
LAAAEFENAALPKLENSYIGLMENDWTGHFSIRLWLKIGIAIISSFAAREVFVGTPATIYSVGGTDNEDTIKK